MSSLASYTSDRITLPLPIPTSLGKTSAIPQSAILVTPATPALTQQEAIIPTPTGTATAITTASPDTAEITSTHAPNTTAMVAKPGQAIPSESVHQEPITNRVFTQPTVLTPPPAAVHAPFETPSGIGGAVSALIIVIALIVILAWLVKRMPNLGGVSNPALQIVGSLALGPHERVLVVAVGNTQLLLGLGAGGIRTLHTLTEPLPLATPKPLSFAQLLTPHFGSKA